MTMRAVIIALVLTLSTTVRAQPGVTPPQPIPAPKATRSESAAAMLSLVGTVAPVGIFFSLYGGGHPNDAPRAIAASAAGFILLPSAGHWYAGRFFTTGMGIRAAGGIVAGLGLGLLVASDGEAAALGIPMFLGGAGTLVLGCAYDLTTAHREVDRWNRKHASLAAPTVMKTGTGYGVGLVGQF